MFKKLLNEFRSTVREPAERRRTLFNEKLESFNDPFAKKISWGPARSGGVGFRTRTMVEVGNDTIKFTPSIFPLAISGASLMLGLWCISSFVTPGIPIAHYFFNLLDVFRNIYFQIQHNTTTIAILLFGLVFVAIGLLGLYNLLRPVKFERHKKLFSRGYPFFRKTSVPFYDIKAIQIISEHCQGSGNNSTQRRPYLSYELNLILKNKSRITVVDHSDASEIRRGGESLSKMLSAPVWDLTKIQ